VKIGEADIFVQLGGEPIKDLLAYRSETNEGGYNGKRRYPIVQKLWT